MGNLEQPSHQWEYSKEKAALSSEQILEISTHNILNNLKMKVLDMHDKNPKADLLDIGWSRYRAHTVEEWILSIPENLSISVAKKKDGDYLLRLKYALQGINMGTDRYIEYLLKEKIERDLWNSLSGEAQKTLQAYADACDKKREQALKYKMADTWE